MPCVSLPRATQDNGKERHLVAVLVFTSKLNLDTEDSRMEKYIFDQSNGLWYELQGDYYIPCLVLDEAMTSPIGMWGRKHQQYLKEHRPMLHGNQIVPTDLFCLSVDRSSLRSHGGRKLVAPHITDMNRRVAYSAFKVREECLLTSSLTLRGEKITKLVCFLKSFSKNFLSKYKKAAPPFLAMQP